MRKWYRVLIVGFLALVIMGCGPVVGPAAATDQPAAATDQPAAATDQPAAATDQPAATDQAAAATDQPSATDSELAQATGLPVGELAPEMQDLVEQALDDLTERLSIGRDEVALVEAEAIVWPDASLGCPQPGMVYAQVQQDGALVVLEYEGRRYAYHRGGNRGLFLCEQLAKNPAATQWELDITKRTPPPRD